MDKASFLSPQLTSPAAPPNLCRDHHLRVCDRADAMGVWSGRHRICNALAAQPGVWRTAFSDRWLAYFSITLTLILTSNETVSLLDLAI